MQRTTLSIIGASKLGEALAEHPLEKGMSTTSPRTLQVLEPTYRWRDCGRLA